MKSLTLADALQGLLDALAECDRLEWRNAPYHEVMAARSRRIDAADAARAALAGGGGERSSLDWWAIALAAHRTEGQRKAKGDRFLHSREWKEVRTKFMADAEPVCAKCGGVTQLQVDHIQPRVRRPDLALAESNLQVLCWPCNRTKAAASDG